MKYHAKTVRKVALPERWATGIYLYCLLPYSPELNDIEPLFRQAKHHELLERHYTSVSALECAIDHSLTELEARIVAKCQRQQRLAA